MKLRSALAVLALATSAGRAGAAPVYDGRLGAPCASVGDCGDGGLLCLMPSADAPAPSGGLCTVPCSTDDDCQSWGENAVCYSLGFCVEGCELNAWFGEGFPSERCHGRSDMACSSYDPLNPAQYDLNAPACTPRCTRDAPCGDGFCNPATGVCEPEPPSGDPPGTRCDSFNGNTCLGVCNVLCAEPCAIGAPGACDGSATNDHGAACLQALPGSGIGDYALCVTLCDCSSECPAAMVCEPWDFQGRYSATGACVIGERPPGATDCIDARPDSGSNGCVYGSVHACRTASCLGTARCLPTGDYSPCECLREHDASSGDAESSAKSDAGAKTDAGAMEAGAEGGMHVVRQPSVSPNCGCQVPGRPDTSGAAALMVAWMAYAARRIRTRRLARLQLRKRK